MQKAMLPQPLFPFFFYSFSPTKSRQGARPRQLASEVAARPTGPHHHNAHRAILSHLRPATPAEVPTAQHGLIEPRSCAQITQRPAIRQSTKSFRDQVELFRCGPSDSEPAEQGNVLERRVHSAPVQAVVHYQGRTKLPRMLRQAPSFQLPGGMTQGVEPDADRIRIGIEL